jgi:hypothetical protein
LLSKVARNQQHSHLSMEENIFLWFISSYSKSEINSEEIHQYLTIIEEYAFDITAVETGFTQGINLGNPDFETLSLPKSQCLLAVLILQMLEKYGICLTKSSYAIN